MNGQYGRGDGVGMERRLIVGVGVVCGSLVMFTAAMCCSRPEFQHSLRDVWLRRERVGALGDRRDAGCFRQEPAMTQRRARQQGARELPAALPVVEYTAISTGLLGQEDCGLWHRIADDKKRFRRSRLSHSDQRDERRVLPSRKRSDSNTPRSICFTQKNTKNASRRAFFRRLMLFLHKFWIAISKTFDG